jgi:hypothetical protein
MALTHSVKPFSCATTTHLGLSRDAIELMRIVHRDGHNGHTQPMSWCNDPGYTVVKLETDVALLHPVHVVRECPDLDCAISDLMTTFTGGLCVMCVMAEHVEHMDTVSTSGGENRI